MKKKLIFISLFLIITSLLLFTGCNKEKASNLPRATPTEMYSGSIPLMKIEPLSIGFVKTDTKLSTFERWQHLVDFLTAKTGIPLEIEVFDNDSELLNAFTLDNMDIAFLDGLAYVQVKEEASVKPILRTIEDGSPFTKSYIIVRSDSGLKNISDLKHRDFAFTDRISASGYLFPLILLYKEGINDVQNYFSNIEFTGDEQSSFIAVYNGYVQAGVVTQSIFNKEDKRIEDITIIAETDPIPLGTIIVKNDLNEEYVNKIKDTLQEIGKTVDTRELSKRIKIDGYVEANDSDYDGIREALKILEELERDTDNNGKKQEEKEEESNI